MPDPDKLPLNETGTHVLTVAPSGVAWECPIGYLETAREHGYKVVGEDEYDAAANAEFLAIANPFNPADHTVVEVNEHLAQAFAAGNVEEVERVLDAEAAGQDRSTINDPTNA